MDGMLPPPPADDPYFYQRLRAQLPPDSPLHAALGPLEHGQFTEETVRANPLMALPLAVATPFYTAGKAAGLIKTRSPASLAEILAAYRGIGRGMLPVPAAPVADPYGFEDESGYKRDWRMMGAGFDSPRFNDTMPPAGNYPQAYNVDQAMQYGPREGYDRTGDAPVTRDANVTAKKHKRKLVM